MAYIVGLRQGSQVIARGLHAWNYTVYGLFGCVVVVMMLVVVDVIILVVVIATIIWTGPDKGHLVALHLLTHGDAFSISYGTFALVAELFPRAHQLDFRRIDNREKYPILSCLGVALADGDGAKVASDWFLGRDSGGFHDCVWPQCYTQHGGSASSVHLVAMECQGYWQG